MSQILIHILVAVVVLAALAGGGFRLAHPSRRAQIFGWPNRITEAVTLALVCAVLSGSASAVVWFALGLTGVIPPE